MNKKIKPIYPLEINETLFINKISKRIGLATNSIPNGNGKFTFIKAITDNHFNLNDLDLIKNGFHQRFNKKINIEITKKNSELKQIIIYKI